MRLRVFSDLHLEFAGWNPPERDCDVVVLAGDIAQGSDGIGWARKTIGVGPAILYVPGNHEYYGTVMPALRRELRAAAKADAVHLLDGDADITIGEVRFLGCTLWTDFELDSAERQDVARAMSVAQRSMPDYQIVRASHEALLSPLDTQSIHRRERAWLAERLTERPSSASRTVVVTHHLPRRESIHRRFRDSLLNPAFASDVSALCGAPAVDLWIHGHTHESFDYMADGCRVFCNPRGYLPDEPNARFDPLGVVEV